MVKCETCDGNGYKIQAYRMGSLVVPVKVWCEDCQGRGEHPYKGDRTGTEWEGE